MDKELHVIFGTGPVGLATMEELVGTGREVRMVNRSGHADLPAGVALVSGDAADRGFATHSARGAAVVYQALNPPYHQWPKLFPGLQNSVLTAARASGAVLVSMENLYMFGPTTGAAMAEDTPMAPTTRKGEVRATMTRELAAAHDRGEVRAVSVRASDFFGPRVLQSALGDRVFARMLNGKSAQVLGDPDLPHTYTYVGDIAKAMVLAGREPSAWGRAWHVPSDETTTTTEIITMIGEVAGIAARARPTPKLILRILSRFDTDVREMMEMLYEFEEPFISDGRALEAKFGFQATPLRPALKTTVDWYRSQFNY